MHAEVVAGVSRDVVLDVDPAAVELVEHQVKNGDMELS